MKGHISRDDLGAEAPSLAACQPTSLTLICVAKLSPFSSPITIKQGKEIAVGLNLKIIGREVNV
jgi:hypothetical protein